ncbi:hypothetical protein HK102_008510, partial [Quaeritorhiza haematococci]
TASTAGEDIAHYQEASTSLDSAASASSGSSGSQQPQLQPLPPRPQQLHPPQTLLPMVKCNSQRSTISGSLPVTGKYGVYTFVWDNTYSLVLSKTISLKVGTHTG